MTITVSVREFEERFTRKVIELNFNGQLNIGEKFNMYASYNMQGKMIDCSAAYSSTNSADYYIEIAEVFKTMKDFEGEKILSVIDKINQIQKPFKIKLEQINEKFKNINEEFKPFRNQYDEINSKLKRARSEKAIKKYEDEISKIKPDYVRLLNEREELNKEYDQVYKEMNEAYKFEIA